MKIVCFGDSLTRGVSLVKGRLRILKENYPTFLQNFFLTNNQSDTIVINKGIFNDNSNLLIKRLDKDVIEENPDIVLIEVGGNDCNFPWEKVANEPNNEHEPIVPLQTYLDNLKKIVVSLKAKNIMPIFLTLPPLDPVKYYRFISNIYGKSISHWISICGGIEHWHSIYNENLNKIAKQLGVMSIDVRAFLKSCENFTQFISDDGIHLNANGYKMMSMNIYQQLLKITDQ
ncbi:SGNH/GDSL hydrolase family protein [Bacillaceae bacterium Marseille-Q3522]|nr:SGNH/GDSL hydrolase family protein [Bacillaceae bacterium Marseille-Q3522]